MKTALLIAGFLLWSGVGYSQKHGQTLIDSLVTELPRAADDSVKLRLYKRIGDEYFFIDTDRALQYSRLGLQHARRMEWPKGIAVFNAALGRAFCDLGSYDSSMYYYRQALALHRELDNAYNIASTLNNMGAAELNITSNYPQAVRYYYEALQWAESIPDNYLIGVCYDNIANVYSVQRNYPKALKYAFAGLKYRQKDTGENSTDREVGQSWASIAAIYTVMNDFKKAMICYRKAIALHRKVGNAEGLARSYTNLSVLYGTDYARKIEYGLKAKKLWDEINPMHSEAIVNTGNLGVAYFDRVRLKVPSELPEKESLSRAETYLRMAIRLSTDKGEASNVAQFTGSLAELQAYRGDYRNAYLNFRAYQAAQDSLYSQESKNQIAGLEGQREIALRDKQIELNKLALEVQRKQRIGLMVGLALLTIIGILLYWQNRTRKRTNTTLLHLNSELDEANKVKAKFFAILSHDLRSPVANLIHFLHIQSEAPELLTPARAAAHQERIATSAETLLDTMESMLLWSKSQMEHFKPYVKEVEVEDLFTYIQRLFAGETTITLTFENPDFLHVATDEDYLKTIMQNLTANAVKALKNTPDGHIHWQARRNGTQVVLTIEDNGPGATEESLGVLFSTTNDIGSRTGLGLHLIRDLAKAIGCVLSFRTTPQVGTLFQLSFQE